jgi:hypothetical protein
VVAVAVVAVVGCEEERLYNYVLLLEAGLFESKKQKEKNLTGTHAALPV